MLLALQSECVYGPVQSRRLGRSLGVNVLPLGRKVCLFDCLYCQYGWTRAYGPGADYKRLPTAELVLRQLEAVLRRLLPAPAYITFSGNGEATLHPEFPALVDGVNELRARLCPSAKTAILSSSATVDRRSVRDALARLDLRIMKLDAGTESLFRRYNGAAKSVDFDAVLEGLASLRDVVIQTLFTGGRRGNAAPEQVEAWIDRVARIAPTSVQLHSLDRDYPSPDIVPLGRDRLRGVATRLERAGISAQVY